MASKYQLRSLYDKYFQKSKAFLLPYVLPEKEKVTQPEHVYVAWEGRYTVKKKRLIVVYKAGDKSAAYKKADAMLTASPLFELKETSPDNKQVIYIFNFTKKAKDWNYFLDGKYSMLSDSLKKQYYTTTNKVRTSIYTYNLIYTHKLTLRTMHIY